MRTVLHWVQKLFICTVSLRFKKYNNPFSTLVLDVIYDSLSITTEKCSTTQLYTIIRHGVTQDSKYL